MLIQDAIHSVRGACTLRHLSFSTEKTYTHWLGRYGISLEQAARDLQARRAVDPTASALKDEQFRRIASMSQNEITMAATLANRPSRIYTNPVLRVCSPLLGWMISKTHDNWKGWRNPNQTVSTSSTFK